MTPIESLKNSLRNRNKTMDLNTLLEDTDNGLVQGCQYDIALYAGQLRTARKLLMDSLPAQTVACMSDDEVTCNLFDCMNFVPVVVSYKDGIDDEVIFLVPKEILKRCKVLQR